MAQPASDESLAGGVRDLVHRLAAALEAGDADAAAACWNEPTMVLSGSRPRLLESRTDAVAFCQEHITAVRERGPGTQNVRIERVEILGPGVAEAEVVWSTPDATDHITTRYVAIERATGDVAFCIAMPAIGRPSASSASEASLTGALEATFPASDPVAASAAGTPGAPDRRHST